MPICWSPSVCWHLTIFARSTHGCLGGLELPPRSHRRSSRQLAFRSYCVSGCDRRPHAITHRCRVRRLGHISWPHVGSTHRRNKYRSVISCTLHHLSNPSVLRCLRARHRITLVPHICHLNSACLHHLVSGLHQDVVVEETMPGRQAGCHEYLTWGAIDVRQQRGARTTGENEPAVHRPYTIYKETRLPSLNYVPQYNTGTLRGC